MWLTLACACLLLAGAQLFFAGYSFGVGNQTIQVPLLQRAVNHALYARDAMITTTAADYPTFFFRILAIPAHVIPIRTLYYLLQIVTAAGVFAAVFALARAMFADWLSGAAAALLLVAGHHQALAGDGLYSIGFTHTFAVFPLAIVALALAYRGRYAWAFAMAGVLFNLHALTAAYLLVLLGGAWIADRPRFSRGLLLAFIGIVTAAPTLIVMLSHRQAFDTQWLTLTRVRSADHSFPSAWWQAGSAELPRFALLAGLFALSLGVRMDRRVRRKSIAMMVAAAALFAAGYVFTDLWPVPLVVRAQLFRCSRLIMVLMLLHIAYAAVCAWRGRRPLEIIAAALLALTLALPPLLPMLPIAFAVALVVVLINGRLSIAQSIAAGVVIFICVAARSDLGFSLFAAPSHFMPNWRIGVGILCLALAVASIYIARLPPRPRLAARGVIALFAGALLVAAGAQPPRDGWTWAQLWARDHTPTDAVFLTPVQPGGFRLQSQRAIVGEWRDGTQLYFSSKFAPMWWDRISALQPGILVDSAGRHILSHGRSMETLDDEALVDLAHKFGATHIILPRGGRPRGLTPVYYNPDYAIYLPTIQPTEAPADAPDADRWQADDRFMRDTVLPNIERNRKGDVHLQLLDTDGRPLAGATVDVHQVRQAFDFSASLPFFQAPAGPSTMGDYQPPPVQQAELDRFLQIFNYTMIPFSSKWMYLEPVEGQRHYEELDRYVDFCTQHDIRIEYHFLSGYWPAWLSRKTPKQQGEDFLRHAKQLAERYGNKIDAWQVTNEGILFQQSPPVFAALRKMLPNAKLGIADCAKFAPESRLAATPALRERDMYRGLDQIRWLKQQGVKVDFFGFHGHRPFGLWPEAKVMYEMFDTFAKEGVRIHVTEVTIPQDANITGPLRSGRLNAAAQAEYYTRFFTICFSHPSVDMVNLWGIGPNTWQRGSGLLNDHYQPKPAFDALKKLITETWRTNVKLTLGLDGTAGFRGFQGDYEATVNLPSGATSTIKFSIEPAKPATELRLKLDDRGTFASRD